MNDKKTNEQKQAVIILYICIGLCILGFIYLLISLVANYNAKTSNEANMGQIQSHTGIKSDSYEYTPSREHLEADKQYYETHGELIAIIDEKSLLSTPGLLSIQLHIIKSELITNFLYENGYENCQYVSVVEESIIIDGSKTEFQLMLNEYPDTFLLVEAYNLTNTMDFQILYSSELHK